MLVLTRKVGQELRISGDIVIRVLSVVGDSVRIGISAPAHIHVIRPEAKVRHARGQTPNSKH